MKDHEVVIKCINEFCKSNFSRGTTRVNLVDYFSQLVWRDIPLPSVQTPRQYNLENHSFRYFGRREFIRLADRLDGSDVSIRCVEGVIGCGKSHLMAAYVLFHHCLRILGLPHNRIIYVSSCARADWLIGAACLKALQVAYPEDEELQEVNLPIDGKECEVAFNQHLIRLRREYKDSQLLVFDELEILFSDPSYREMRQWVERFVECVYVYSGFPDVFCGLCEGAVFTVQPSLTNDEWNAWRMFHLQPQLTHKPSALERLFNCNFLLWDPPAVPELVKLQNREETLAAVRRTQIDAEATRVRAAEAVTAILNAGTAAPAEYSELQVTLAMLSAATAAIAAASADSMAAAVSAISMAAVAAAASVLVLGGDRAAIMRAVTAVYSTVAPLAPTAAAAAAAELHSAPSAVTSAVAAGLACSFSDASVALGGPAVAVAETDAVGVVCAVAAAVRGTTSAAAELAAVAGRDDAAAARAALKTAAALVADASGTAACAVATAAFACSAVAAARAASGGTAVSLDAASVAATLIPVTFTANSRLDISSNGMTAAATAANALAVGAMTAAAASCDSGIGAALASIDVLNSVINDVRNSSHQAMALAAAVAVATAAACAAALGANGKATAKIAAAVAYSVAEAHIPEKTTHTPFEYDIVTSSAVPGHVTPAVAADSRQTSLQFHTGFEDQSDPLVPSLWVQTLVDNELDKRVRYVTSLNPMFLTQIDKYRNFLDFEDALEAFDAESGYVYWCGWRLEALMERFVDWIRKKHRDLLDDYLNMMVNAVVFQCTTGLRYYKRALVDKRFFNIHNNCITPINGYVAEAFVKLLVQDCELQSQFLSKIDVHWIHQALTNPVNQFVQEYSFVLYHTAKAIQTLKPTSIQMLPHAFPILSTPSDSSRSEIVEFLLPTRCNLRYVNFVVRRFRSRSVQQQSNSNHSSSGVSRKQMAVLDEYIDAYRVTLQTPKEQQQQSLSFYSVKHRLHATTEDLPDCVRYQAPPGTSTRCHHRFVWIVPDKAAAERDMPPSPKIAGTSIVVPQIVNPENYECPLRNS